MASLILTPITLPAYVQRFEHLHEHENAQWGSLTPIGMMRHIRFIVEVSLGNETVPDKSTFLTRTVLKYLFFHVMTNWPRGKIKAPENYTPEAEGSFTEERDALIEALTRFVGECTRNPNRVTISELLGPIPLEYWARVHGVHINHHLKQFGV